jgi:hypothetical protein
MILFLREGMDDSAEREGGGIAASYSSRYKRATLQLEIERSGPLYSSCFTSVCIALALSQIKEKNLFLPPY